jgi:hypothetical protein
MALPEMTAKSSGHVTAGNGEKKQAYDTCPSVARFQAPCSSPGDIGSEISDVVWVRTRTTEDGRLPVWFAQDIGRM